MSRFQLQIVLIIILVAGLYVLVPRFLSVTQLALRELRSLWWMFLLVGGSLWLLLRVGRKR